MAKKRQVPVALTSYELLGQWIQRVINSPRAQSEHYAVITCEPEESLDNWARLLEEFETHDHVVMTHQDDGSVALRWNPNEAM